MIIDNKGKLFGKISIVDICVLLVVVIGIVGALFAMSTLDSSKLANNSKLALNSASEIQTATVTFELKGVRSITKDSIIEGDGIYDTEDELYIGEIKSVSSKASTQNIFAQDGTIHVAKIPERMDVTLEVEVKGKTTDSGFYTESGVQLLYGKDIEVKTSTVKTMPIIKGIAIK